MEDDTEPKESAPTTTESRPDPEPDLPNPLAYQTRNGKPDDHEVNVRIKLKDARDYETS